MMMNMMHLRVKELTLRRYEQYSIYKYNEQEIAARRIRRELTSLKTRVENDFALHGAGSVS